MSKFFEAVNKMDPLLADPTLASAEPPAAGWSDAPWAAADEGPDDDADMPGEPAPPYPAEPVTVPTLGYMPRRRGGGRRFARALLLTLAALAVVAAALYFTGALGALTGLFAPRSQGGVPAGFGRQPESVASAVPPAARAPAPALSGFTISPQSAAAPATLTFTLLTNAEADSIRLMNGENALIPAVVSKAPQGDGLVWTALAAFDKPYAGSARAYLRDADGQWRACDPAVTVEVR